MWKQRIKTNKWNNNASHTIPYLIFWFPKFHGIIQDMWTSESEDMIFIYKSNGRHGPPPICLFHYFSPNPATAPFVEDQSKSRGSLLPLFSVSNFSHHCWPSLKWRRFKTVLNTELNDVVWLLVLTFDYSINFDSFHYPFWFDLKNLDVHKSSKKHQISLINICYKQNKSQILTF